MAECNSDGRTTMPIRCEPNIVAGDFRSANRSNSLLGSEISIGAQSSIESTGCLDNAPSMTSSSRIAFGGGLSTFESKVMSSSLSNASKLGSRFNGGRKMLMGADELKAAYWKRFGERAGSVNANLNIGSYFGFGAVN